MFTDFDRAIYRIFKKGNNMNDIVEANGTEVLSEPVTEINGAVVHEDIPEYLRRAQENADKAKTAAGVTEEPQSSL
jgi:hypothetical protein